MYNGDKLAGAASRLSVKDGKDTCIKANFDGVNERPKKMILPEPTSTIVGDKRLWNVTEQFRAAASTLPVGKLVKDEQFTLFESVGALEIMDPKMDSGFLAPGETLVDDYDIFRELLPEEVIGIMDQLLCCEMAWHEGYPLAQTIFTCHYIDRLLSFESRVIEKIHFSRLGDETRGGGILHTVLRAYCIGLIKCCDYVLDEINRSLDGGGTRVNFYEEEDFSGHTYGRELFTRIPKQAIIGILYQAAEWVDDQLKNSKKNNQGVLAKFWEAIRTRLDFRITLLLAMATDEPVEYRLGYWRDVSTQLPLLLGSHSFSKPVSESFSPKIQRRLASTVPPKPMVELSFSDAYAKMVQMCKDCEEAARIVEFGPEHVQRLKAFLWSFSARKPEPLSYARACLSAPLFTCDERGFETLLRRDLEEMVLPQDPVLDPINSTFEAPQNSRVRPDPRFELANTVGRFTETAIRMSGGYIDFYRALCSNRCRLRRNLVHVVHALEDHQNRETEQLDEILHSLSPDVLRFPLSTWVYHQKLRMMELIVQLGFELDVYLPDELAGMYWYLSILSSSRAAVLNLILPHLRDRLSRSQQAKKLESEIQSSITLLEAQLHESRGTESLSSALSSLYIYNSYLHLIPDTASKSKFHCAKLRYELRMKPFLSITAPELPPFQEYDEVLHPFGPYTAPTVDLKFTNGIFLQSIEDDLKTAKIEFAGLKKIGPAGAGSQGMEEDWGKNVSSVLASCIAAGIALSTMKAAAQESSPKPSLGLKLDIPEIEKRYHDWWIVPKITNNGK